MMQAGERTKVSLRTIFSRKSRHFHTLILLRVSLEVSSVSTSSRARINSILDRVMRKRTEARKVWEKKYRETHLDYYAAKAAEYRAKDPLRFKKVLNKSRAKLKAEAIAAFGGECECCKESNPGFLTIDHINNDGAKHRKTRTHSFSMWRVAKKEGYPRDKYRLLCWNCNCGRAKNGGVCPHKSVA